MGAHALGAADAPPLTVGIDVPGEAASDLRRLLTEAAADRPGVEFVWLAGDDGDGDPGAAPERPIRALLAAPWLPRPVEPGWFRGVEWVHALSAGVDSAPPWLLRAPLVTCSRGVHAPQIAEWVIGALLTEAHPTPWITEPAPTGRPVAGDRVLAGSTLGIVGLGQIGQAVARRALALDLRVVATRRRPGPPAVPGVELAPDLADLLAVSDAVLLSAAATPATRHLVDDAALARVKPGLHLLNVARGSLVDHDALRRALDDGRVRAATLDVTDPEPLPAGHWLYHHPKVRVSPHLAAWAPDLPERLVERFLANLDRFRAGLPLEGLVDPALGY